MTTESGFIPHFHEEFLAIYAELCKQVPDFAKRVVGICDDIVWARGTKEWRNAVHYGLMHEWRTQEARIAALTKDTEPMVCDGDFPDGFNATFNTPAQALRTANAMMCDMIGKREWDVPCAAQYIIAFVEKYIQRR